MYKNSTSIIEKGTRFEGNLTFSGVLRISGEFYGNIYTTDTLVINEEAYVEGTIEANSVIISGLVKGEIKASSRVEMKSPAKFTGKVRTPSLIVEEGVIFHGETQVEYDDENS
jgi:cytoskeletal protein CcmA (bactofilin family)